VLRAKQRAPTPYFSVVFTLDPHLSLSRCLEAHHSFCCCDLQLGSEDKLQGAMDLYYIKLIDQ
jgi:hypothetical protein